MTRPASPEEVEEPLEAEVERRGRAPLPRSARRDLLLASPSRRSAGSRTATLTPTPSEIHHRRTGSLLAIHHSSAPGTIDEEGKPGKQLEQPTLASSEVPVSEKAIPSNASSSTSPSTIVIDVNVDQDDFEDDEPEIIVQRKVEAEPSKSTHGPRALAQDLIDIDSDFDQVDIPSSSSSSIHSFPSHRQPAIRKHKGAPYVEIPFLPLSRLKNYTFPTGTRGPNPLSRNEQLQFTQTPPRSTPASSEASGATWRASRPNRSGLFPQWATMPKDDSSDDLGGYGMDESDDEIESSDGYSSDGIPITTRRIRTSGKGKGREVETRRTTRAEAAVSKFLGNTRSLRRRMISISAPTPLFSRRLC
jgi:hypothetical protein